MDYGTLKKRLGRRRGFDGNEARLGDFINDAYMTICGRRQNWSWLRKTFQFNLFAPETGAAASVENNEFAVIGLAAITKTRTGARFAGPDGVVYRIASHTPGTTAYLEARYTGATAASQNWSIYYDEYPLPEGTMGIESIVCTGNGFTFHVTERGLLPQDMKALTIKDHESYPQYYSIERHNHIPAPDIAPTAVVSGDSGLLAAGYYKYKYRYYNTKTMEVGPFSDEVEIQVTAANNAVDLTWTARGDYGVALYRTRASSASVGRGASNQEFFHLANSATFSFSSDTDALADASIGWAARDIDTAGGYEADGVSIGNLALKHQGRAFISSGSHHIRLWPPPDANYILDMTYFAAPQEMRLENDAPLIPRQFYPAVLDLAESYALGEEESHSAASHKRAIAMEMVDRMERDEEKDPGTRIQIGRGAGGQAAGNDGFGKTPGLTVILPPTDVGPWG
jgi:hypothetical protein|tara:strand:+ start:4509 stop:5870 length:1362 start_codon:yes stop_codon:yes gene_type:complete